MTWLRAGVAGVRWRADLPDVLAELGARYQLMWATTWEDNANLLLAPALGLPSLPVLRFSGPGPADAGGHDRPRTWKLASVRRLGDDRPLAWIDDELHADAYAWATARSAPTKLIATDPRYGITDREVRALLAFARG